MRVQSLEMAIIFVDDFKAMKYWYQLVLGLELIESNDEGQWATLKFPKGDCEIALHGGLPVARLAQNGVPPVCLTMRVEDLDGVVDELKSKGVKFIKEIRTIQERMRAADFVDPEGNLMQVFE